MHILLWFMQKKLTKFQQIEFFDVVSKKIISCSQGFGEKIFQGVRRSIPGPQILLGPQALSGPMPLNHFLSDGCRFSFKSEGITIHRIQLGPMKNTTRHKIGLNPARGFGGAQ